MKNGFKFLLIFSILFMFFGCNKKEEKTFDFIMIYANWCPTCEAAKEKFIPKLEEQFGEKINIFFYDIDTQEGMEVYKKYIGYIDENGNEVNGLLKDVDLEFKEVEQFPLFIVDGYYAFFNWASAYNDALVTDVKNILEGQEIRPKIYDVFYYFE